MGTFTEDSPAHRIIHQGHYEILPPAGYLGEAIERVYQLLLQGVAEVESPQARAVLERDGLTRLHQMMGAEKVGALRDYVMDRARPELFATTCRLGREYLGIEGEFFLDDYAILRINYPFEVARNAPMAAENPGIGRLSAEAKAHYQANKRPDPSYDPKGYQKNLPPAAWAHGPHLDTWAGHSRFGINLWWAVDETLAENSMVFYPKFWDRHPRPNPRTLYLDAGYPLEAPLPMPLKRGELLVFNPELLHGTHLNVTDRTRIALTLRINPARPRFSAGCFYAREYWQSSQAIEAGEFDRILRFERGENLIPPEEEITAIDPPTPYPTLRLERPLGSDGVTIEAGRLPAPGGKLLILLQDRELMLIRTPNGTWRATDALCPHLDVNLMDGAHDDEAIHCPGCGVRYGLADGGCSSSALRLPCYGVEARAGGLLITARPSA